VPRSKYTKAPGLLPPVDRITRATFRFDNKATRDLIGLLPPQLRDLRVPENFAKKLANATQLKTMAQLIVALTEEGIQSYLTRKRAGSTPANPANVKAAIRKLRAALKPFVSGSVDDETANIIPDDLDLRLANRERALSGKRLPPAKRRYFVFLCRDIGMILKLFASANQVAFKEREAIRYVATALDHAGIEHSYSTENPSRFATMVFPRS
jgi:hypothetical protein